jgi:hypothetical protein
VKLGFVLVLLSLVWVACGKGDKEQQTPAPVSAKPAPAEPTAVPVPSPTEAPAAAAPTAAAPTAEAPAATPPAPAPAAETGKPPSLSSKTFLAAKSADVWVDPARGLWVAVDDKKPILSCGSELKASLARAKAILKEARSAGSDGEFAEPVKCEAKGSALICTYTHPMADPDIPDSMADFVFASGAKGKPVLVALALGSASPDKLDLAPTTCP